MNQILFRSALMLALLTPLQSCGFFTYQAEPIQAWVVDAETNQPLEGVIVAAHWQLKGGLEGGNPVGQMMVMETVTDAKGRFYFPGWGPKLRSLKGKLKTESPGLVLFRSGYAYRELENHLTLKALRGELEIPLRSDWDKKTIPMEEFKGTREEYAEHVHSLDNGIEWARYGENCEWKEIPRMLVEIHHLGKQFDAHGIKLKGWRGGARIRKISDVGNHTQCGSAEEFFRDYLP